LSPRAWNFNITARFSILVLITLDNLTTFWSQEIIKAFMAAGAQPLCTQCTPLQTTKGDPLCVCSLTCRLADLTPATSTPVHATARTAHGFERPPEVLAAHAVQHEVDSEVGVEQNVADVLQNDQVVQPFVTLGRRLQQSQSATGIN
jgi:hypothetical protein